MTCGSFLYRTKAPGHRPHRCLGSDPSTESGSLEEEPRNVDFLAVVLADEHHYQAVREHVGEHTAMGTEKESHSSDNWDTHLTEIVRL